MLNDFTWNMTGYIPKHQVNPHGDGIVADKLKQCNATTLITVSKIIDALIDQQNMLPTDQSSLL